MAKSCKECMAANQRRSVSEVHKFETPCHQGLFAAESLFKCTLLLVICKHNINSCVRCSIGWLYICFACERCNMSSINKRSTRKVNSFKETKFNYTVLRISFRKSFNQSKAKFRFRNGGKTPSDVIN